MESANPSVFTADNNEGVERVKKGKGNYAYLMESTSIEYVIERNCGLTQFGGMLDSKGYGIAMPPSKLPILFFYIPFEGTILSCWRRDFSLPLLLTLLTTFTFFSSFPKKNIFLLTDSPFRTAISGAILKLQEEGKLHILKTRWWKEKKGGGACRVIMIFN